MRSLKARTDYAICVDASATHSAVAGAARACTALRHAHVLAEWAGDGKTLTAKGVLRRADVAPAGHALGIDVPGRVRTAADLPELHRPWIAALELGLVAISGGKAMPGPYRTSWPPNGDEDMLDHWSRALVTVLADTFDAEDRGEVWEVGRIALTVLANDPPTAGDHLRDTIERAAADTSAGVFELMLRNFGTRHPAAIVLGVLSAFGAVTNDEERPAITPLGHWARTEISARGIALSSGSPAGSGPAVGTACQLKIALKRVRPPCWRRMVVPAAATLTDLDEIIQIAFDWDNDHLHMFTIGRRSYGDPAFDAEFSEGDMTLSEAFSRRATISYVYDLGDNWLHEITLEETRPLDSETTYPTCTGGKGDAPVEDWIGEGPDSTPFDRTEINTRLAALTHRDRQVGSDLNEVVATILTDAYGEAEEITAFECVLDEEIGFPVPATLLGDPLIVTGLDSEAETPQLRACCKKGDTHSSIAFADLTFRPGTVEAWLHAAYLTYLGRPQPGAIPPRQWDGLGKWIS